MQRTAQQIDRAAVPYELITSNSNSGTSGTLAGADKDAHGLPGNLFIPGLNQPIGVPGNTAAPNPQPAPPPGPTMSLPQQM